MGGPTARLWALVTAALLCAASPAAAVILNPSFETGDASDWTTTGNTAVVDDTFGVTPLDQNYQILLSTEVGAVDAATLEATMGLSAGFLTDRLGEIFPKTKGTTVTEGSAIQQTFTAQAGDTLVLNYNFLTNEVPPEQTFSDFLFYDLNGVESGVLASSRLQPSQFDTSGSSFNGETGYQTFEIIIPIDGTYTLTVGVADVDDTFRDSAAIFDGFDLRKVPEPDTFALLGIGLVGLGWQARRERAHRTS